MDLEYKKNKMIKDIQFLCSNCQLSDTGKYAILDDITWRYSERTDIGNMGKTYDWNNENPNSTTKILGNKYWSENALRELKKLSSNNEFTNSSINKKLNVIFEHIVPRKIFIEYIINNGNQLTILSKDELKNLLDNVLIGCIITKDEDKKLNADKVNQRMPNGETDLNKISHNPWARYDYVGIKHQIVNWGFQKAGNKHRWKMI